MKNLWKALIVSWSLILWWYWLKASAENRDENYDCRDKMELICGLSKHEIVSDFTENEEISRFYKDLRDSKDGKWLIEFYGSKQYISQYKDKMNKLGSQENVWEVVVKDKIQKILKSLEKDVKKNPGDFWFWDSKGKFLLDSAKVNERVLSKVNYEFSGYVNLKKVEKNGVWIVPPIIYSIMTLIMSLIFWGLSFLTDFYMWKKNKKRK